MRKVISLPSFIWVALLLRLIWLSTVAVDPVSDGNMYKYFSYSIAAGKGYSYPEGNLTAYWAVGTSAFYAVFHYLFGFISTPIVLINLFVGLGIVCFTYLLASAYFGMAIGRISAWLVAVWPVLIQFTTVYASELIFIFFLLATLCVWRCWPSTARVRALCWGALLCIATYVRPTALPLFIVLPFLDYLHNRDIKKAAASLVVAVCAAAALFAPWVVRNQQLFGSPVLVSVNFGTNLWMGNNPQSNGGYMELPAIAFTNEVERDQYFKNEAIEFIKANPLQYLNLAVRRAVITFDRETIGVAWNEPALRRLVSERGLMGVKVASTAYWWLVLAAAICGVAVLLWRKKSNVLHPLIVVSGLFFIVPILTVGQDRYHMPLIPFLAIFAAVALESAWKWFVTKRNREFVPEEPHTL